MSDALARAPFRDPALSPEKRSRDLLARMTRDEKIAQLCSVWLMLDPDGGEFAPFQGAMVEARDPSVSLRHGIGQITRPFGSRPVEPRAGTRALNAFQKHLVEDTRLGIPAIAHEESLTGFMAQGATQFPSPLNYGATWDPDLIRRVAGVIRRQMRAVGTHQALAPVADVIRDARWGRVEECVAEDPHLVGAIVSAYVEGLQGDDLADGIVATLKHFCGYSGSAGGRNFAPTQAGPREMADRFLVPFEMAVKTAGARSVMNAYQEVDGQPAASSRELLTATLRERWGFDGIVVADYFAVKMLHLLHHTAEGPVEASAQALAAGLDVELPQGDCYWTGLAEALDRGLVAPDVLDVAVDRVLRLKFELGLFERPYADAEAVVLELPEERALARDVAARSITLLANDGALPLRSDARVAVIGPNAADDLALFGNYSFQNHVASHYPDRPLPVRAPTLLDVLRERLGADRVEFAQGCRILRDPGGDPLRLNPESGGAVGGAAPALDADRSGIAPAAEAAARADVAVVVVGDKAGHFRSGTVGEGTDASDLALPGVQPALLAAVLETGTPTVVVLVNGRPPALDAVDGRAAAIVEAWFPGQDGAAAVVDVLLGDANPGGKTTVSFSRGAGVQPAAYDHKALARGIPPHPDFEPVFPFGHGLSYTRFEYEDLALSADRVPTDGAVEVSFTLRNAGDRAGDEVVQLYLRDEVASVTRPVQELRGFRRVALAAGAAARVHFELPAALFAFTGPALRRIVEPGRAEVRIGASSRDSRLTASLELTGTVHEVGEERPFLAAARIEPL
ncbi:MAG: glycoside hydrolase family 3 N-terminal domain-containing protein [Myxococcota bacterium]|nr:glycoside hydrolase family 3 N-terminal domain-containing protein [Myxococcota bacterium]